MSLILNSEKLILPNTPPDKKIWANLKGSSSSFLLSKIAGLNTNLKVLIVQDILEANRLMEELKFFMSSDTEILLFPDWETLPYDSFSPHVDIIAERLRTLYRLKNLSNVYLIVPVTTLIHPVPPLDFLLKNTLILKNGDKVNLSALRLSLEQSGYRCVSQVMEHGEFAVRGSIIDLYPSASHTPFRIDLFDEVIDSIRIFDVDTQRTSKLINAIDLLPAREYPLTDESVSLFRSQWREQFEGDPTLSPLYNQVSDKQSFAGIEYYLPLFFDKASYLFDYLPKNTLIIKLGDFDKKLEDLWNEINYRFNQYGHDITRPILKPEQFFLKKEKLNTAINQFALLQLEPNTKASRSNCFNFNIQNIPTLNNNQLEQNPLILLANFRQTFNGRILLCAESNGRKEMLTQLLAQLKVYPKVVENWQGFLDSSEALCISVGFIYQGFIIEDSYAIISEAEIFGRKALPTKRRQAKHQDFDASIRSIAELSLNGPVVHLDYGIGRYLGLNHITVNNIESEFVHLEYAGGDKLYIPVSSLHLISRYMGANVEHAPLHRLGSPEWQKAKRKAFEQVKDVAAELLTIYAQREAKQGFAFPGIEEHYQAFASIFPFEETPDQEKAIQAVIGDLMAAKPMDRVVCGDVGFGKTEVALRAAFLVVNAGKQVAVLVPTTLLAEQHFTTFVDRFSQFPVKIEVLSRFKSTKEQSKIIEALNNGKVDIIIGTHKLLQESIVFKDLGLVIIDEEHRFGVRQKERFKSMRSHVDTLALTATPIPRTLNMALASIRDLSIIATPPAKRLSIKTFVREYNTHLIQEAVLRELHRGGQVYYLHNSVETIQRRVEELQTIIPSAKIMVAHGQMRERELEQVMSDFYHHRFNVLVCTTIIETGIDIPTANTIIIERADKLGLAQLHQLRGRVGRSHHQAYAFCLTPPEKAMTRDAAKRLEALASLENLGSGFTIATHDLEIRGAGELLGEEQSGEIEAIGFNLYMELLEQTVKALREGKTLSFEVSLKKGTEIDLQMPAIIPDNYLPDIPSRLVLYKRVSDAKTLNALKDLEVEMIDRFGEMPVQTQNLLKITSLKLKATPLGITKIEAGAKGGRLEFSSNTCVDPKNIIQLIQKEPTVYKLEGGDKIKFSMDLSDRENRLMQIEKLLNYLKG
ncbi:MAG: mfd [Francisellaceae bacterium]|nr:mfd [Francisellaceae bacterium]